MPLPRSNGAGGSSCTWDRNQLVSRSIRLFQVGKSAVFAGRFSSFFASFFADTEKGGGIGVSHGVGQSESGFVPLLSRALSRKNTLFANNLRFIVPLLSRALSHRKH